MLKYPSNMGISKELAEKTIAGVGIDGGRLMKKEVAKELGIEKWDITESCRQMPEMFPQLSSVMGNGLGLDNFGIQAVALHQAYYLGERKAGVMEHLPLWFLPRILEIDNGRYQSLRQYIDELKAHGLAFSKDSLNRVLFIIFPSKSIELADGQTVLISDLLPKRKLFEGPSASAVWPREFLERIEEAVSSARSQRRLPARFIAQTKDSLREIVATEISGFMNGCQEWIDDNLRTLEAEPRTVLWMIGQEDAAFIVGVGETIGQISQSEGLLSPEQELFLGRVVQLYVGTEKTEPTEENSRLYQLVRELGEEAIRLMVERNVGLVKKVAGKKAYQVVPFDDLVQEGLMGLRLAVLRYDPRQGYKFSTCAIPWIKRAIKNAVTEQSRTIKIPRHCQQRINQIMRVFDRLAQELGRYPTIGETATEMGIKREKIERLLMLTAAYRSIDGGGGVVFAEDWRHELKSPFASPEEVVLEQEQSDALRRTIEEAVAKENLSVIEATVLILYFYLDYELPQIAEELAVRGLTTGGRVVTGARVGQIRKGALEKMRQAMEE